jgi:hypothetical protein
MRSILLFSTLLLTPSPVSAVPAPEGPRAPSGYEPFCVPLTFGFVEATPTITPESLEHVPAILEVGGFRQSEWFYLAVDLARSARPEEQMALAQRRAAEVVRTFSEFGIRADRNQVEFVPTDRPVGNGGAYFSLMIPPDQVARVREAEATGVVIC